MSHIVKLSRLTKVLVGLATVWRDEARLLAKYDLGLPELFLDPQRLIVRAEDRAYLLDLAWLRAMGGDPAALASEELVRIICEGPMASGLFDESTLVPYLDGGQPQACTNSVPLSTGREGLKGEVFDSYLDKLTAFDTFPSGIDNATGI